VRSRLDRLGRRLPGGRWHVFTEAAELGAAELGAFVPGG
jgi:hypothetical protein